jgi:hypothetical protein
MSTSFCFRGGMTAGGDNQKEVATPKTSTHCSFSGVEGRGGDRRNITTPKTSEALVSELGGGGWWVSKGGGDQKKVATPKMSTCARFEVGWWWLVSIQGWWQP